MHRRGLTLLLGFLVAIVVAGGGGVRAPWLPVAEPASPTVTRSAIAGHVAAASGRIRME